METNTDLWDIKNEPIQTDMCRKRTVYGKQNGNTPIRWYAIIQQTEHEYMKTIQMIIIQVIVNYDNNSQPHKQTRFATTHIVVWHIVATQRRLNKFIAIDTHIVVKTVYTELVK